MKGLIQKYGRKFFLALVGLGAGFLVTTYGISRADGSPSSIAEMVGSFAVLLGVIYGAFSGADSLNTWSTRGKSRVTTEESASKTVVEAPPPRPSGTVTDPPKEE